MRDYSKLKDLIVNVDKDILKVASDYNRKSNQKLFWMAHYYDDIDDRSIYRPKDEIQTEYGIINLNPKNKDFKYMISASRIKSDEIPNKNKIHRFLLRNTVNITDPNYYSIICDDDLKFKTIYGKYDDLDDSKVDSNTYDVKISYNGTTKSLSDLEYTIIDKMLYKKGHADIRIGTADQIIVLDGYSIGYKISTIIDGISVRLSIRAELINNIRPDYPVFLISITPSSDIDIDLSVSSTNIRYTPDKFNNKGKISSGSTINYTYKPAEHIKYTVRGYL